MQPKLKVSLAVFGPQSRAPTPAYLDSVRTFMTNHCVLGCVVREISTLRQVLSLLADKIPGISNLDQAPRYADFLIRWLADGPSEAAASASSGIVALPRLAIIQFAQYFQFLESRQMTHAQFIAAVRDSGGSIQGYCGGLPAAAALACARTDEELSRFMCAAIRQAFAIGLCAELGDDSGIPGTTTMVIRLKTEGQAEELVSMFPHTHISAITDPKSVSVVGPAKQLADLQAHAQQQLGLLVQAMDIRGKTHNPENANLAAQLSVLCQESALLDLPGPERLQVPVRSNRSGELISGGSLTDEVVQTVLASRCEWFELLSNVAADLKRANVESHGIVSFGIGDCVPLIPFNRLGLRVTKAVWSSGQTRGESPKPARTESFDFGGLYSYPEDAVAIIGASCRLPGAKTLHELWELVAKGDDRHEELKPGSRFDLHGGYRASQSGNFTTNRKFYANFVDGIDRFDNAFFGVNAREALNMDPQQRMLLELAYEAMESSGYTRTHVRSRGDPVGCFIGASFVEYLDNTNAHGPTAYTSTGTIRAFLCGRLSYYFGWSGPAEVIDTACSSSLVAINRAVRAVQSGECPMALAGGVNLITGANNFLDLGRAGFLSPTGQCKPFDKDADGYCRAEGAGLVVLKPLKQALADRDAVMAVIPGAATNQGGLSRGLTVPDSNAQVRLYQSVLKQANMGPELVTYAEAHGTGTQAGDPLEIASVRSVFGSPARRSQLHIGSIKGNIGHCETAAGVAGLLKVVCMLEHRRIPPQASHRVWNPKIPALSPDNMAITTSLQAWDCPFRAALVNSYGAAGSNAAALCCEAPKSLRQVVDASRVVKPGEEDHSVIVSAASISSLERFQTALAGYLAKAEPQPKLAEIAYTLSEKRRRHKYYSVFETSQVPALIQALAANQLPVLERSSPLPVVLVFGGQSKQTIGLNKDVYEHFVAFRTAVNTCDTILQELGYPSILPAVFQTTDIDDIVVLQTGFVAVQYASANTWLKAGLEVNSLVGHSLGELTALAVSGRLSLRDCLKLVAARATLMKTEWGPEKGAMLALFASRSATEDILATNSSQGKLEIACYNADTSHVVSGDGAAVDELEKNVMMLSRSPPIKCLRVATSNGFHSRLVEPILAKLDKVSSALEWKTPSLAVELCTETYRDPNLPYSPSDHARDPVFFSAAVQRLEKRLGCCVWLEAGMDTPIIPMTKRAVTQPDGHSFHALSTRSEAMPINVVTRSVCALWKASLDVSHWSFVERDCAPPAVWLPPYQFDATTAWLENIDRAATLQRQMDERPAGVDGPASEPRVEKPRMVTLLPETGECDKTGATTKRFRVAVEGERFRAIVAGHAVRNRPLCPASVYMECAAMGLDLISERGSLTGSFLDFEGLDIQAPLGVATQNVELVLRELGTSPGRQLWEFTIVSRDPSNKPGRTTLHAKGKMITSSESKLATMARLVEKQMQALDRNDKTAERMLSKRAYDLFSRVVSYEKFLEGIARITMSGTEAAADICIPPGQPGVGESTVMAACDAVTLDNFIQVVGLLMNTSDSIGKDEVMVCSGIENSMVAKGCNMEACRSWKVHASYTLTSQSQAIGDVFAFSAEDGAVVAAFTGCRFAKLGMTRLERLLDPVNRVSPGGSDTKDTRHEPQTVREVLHRSATTPPEQEQGQGLPPLMPDSGSSSGPPTDGVTTPSSDTDNHNLRQILETYTGVAVSSMLDDSVVADLGLDSLAATEMAEELRLANLVPPIDSQDLMGMTIKQLEQRVYSMPLQSGKATAVAVQRALNRVTAEDSTDRSSRHPSQKPHHGGGNQGAKSPLQAKLTELLIETTGVEPSLIKPQTTLEELGVDSLALTEILSALADAAPSDANLDTGDVTLQSSVEEVLHMIGATSDGTDGSEDEGEHHHRVGNNAKPGTTVSLNTGQGSNETLRMKTNLAAGLRACQARFESAARDRGFQNYWGDVAVKQDRLVLAYTLEAFRALGVDFGRLSEGEPVPPIRHHPRHLKVVQRLWGILEKHGIVAKAGPAQVLVRGSKSASALAPASQLHDELVREHPAYAIEARLMALTGPELAECLKGDVDPIKLLFGSAKAAKILEEYYGRSPMLSTLTSQLVAFVMGSLDAAGSQGRPTTLRVLEVGAGTGGTTAELVECLGSFMSRSGARLEYTFTDVSSTMVAKAKTRFARYAGSMSFERLDLEKEPPEHLQGRFDMVIGTNCVHATSSRVGTIRRIRQMLHRDGFMVLSEVTRIIDWYDLVFGLLEGWWTADGGASYPLQPAENWMAAFREAGFPSATCSRGGSEDASTQQLLVGSNSFVEITPDLMPPAVPTMPLVEKKTVVYKEVSGIRIEADVYLPAPTSCTPCLNQNQPMAIALLIHGGGHMTLSRRAIRPAQVAHLLANNALPVSIDYRLCPEINVLDGAMADVRDAVLWARHTLPSLVDAMVTASPSASSPRRNMLTLDPSRVVVVGYSTGGHLALSTAWTLAEAGHPTPRAVLCFYAPVDFSAADVFPRGHQRTLRIPRRLPRDVVLAMDVSAAPLTSYEIGGGGGAAAAAEDAELGWVKPGDVRSELLLSLFREPKEFGLALMLNGGRGEAPPKTAGELVAVVPEPERLAAMCPTLRLRAGGYKVPTFIIHGEKDEIALFESARGFYDEMRRQGIRAGFLAVKDGSHVHDLRLKPGMAEWEEQVAPGYRFLFDVLRDECC